MKRVLIAVGIILGLVVFAKSYAAVLIGFGSGEASPASSPNTYYVSAGLVPIDSGDTATANTYYIAAGLVPSDD